MDFNIAKILIFFCVSMISINGQFHRDSCVRRIDDLTGVCEFLDDCPTAQKEFNEGIKPQICSFVNRKAIVCCRKNIQSFSFRSQTTRRISADKCEQYRKLTVSEFNIGLKIKRIIDCVPVTSLIVGGQFAKLGEFPHMAAIGWRYDGKLDFACGGSLISEKFVLTAAHCLIRNKLPPNIVVLGEQNLKSDLDGAQPQGFRVKRTIKHENYSKGYTYYDIALLEMDRSAIFNKFVRPACLWQDLYVPSQTATATGWGLLEYLGPESEELQKVSLTLMQNRDCQPYFNHIVRFTDKLKQGIVDSQVCAAAIEGGRLVGGKDTCQGDSGGPLQITLKDNPCVHHVVGLTSFAAAGCAEENSPGVYTRVSEYIDWIELKVWPEYIN
jgi:hypothetical protein